MAKKPTPLRPAQLEKLLDDFYDLRNAEKGEKRIKEALEYLESDQDAYLSPWYKFSKENSHVYPSQGLLQTPHDYLDYRSLQMLPQETIIQTLRMRRFFLEVFNHPYRIHHLDLVNAQPFTPVPKVDSIAMEYAQLQGLAISIGDLGSTVIGSEKERISRNERYGQGPFVKLGKQARTFFVGSESPDVWNSAAAIATMAASHCMSAIPRNGVLSDVRRQADIARESLMWLENLAEEILGKRKDRAKVLGYWRKNITGAVEASPDKAKKRADALYDAGIRSFRVYSPEPGSGAVLTTKALRKHFGNDVEILTGQIVDVKQAKDVEEAGADALHIGIGGGGRCITGVRSGSVIDWPELLWKLRGETNLPIIVQGGASDNVATTLLLGASGIGVSRAVSGGTIESPGGALFCVDDKGHLFKPYGGEASARTKYLDGKLMPFDVPSFVEGETTKASMSYVKFVYPTLTYNLHLLIEDSILALVFRGAKDIHQLHAINPSPLRQNTSFGSFQKNTH